MFEPSANPRVFCLPPGVDFPRALVDGLRTRMSDVPPHALAKVTVIVNTRRMARRIRDIFDSGPPCLLPSIRLLSDLDTFMPGVVTPPAVSPLARRLDLIKLISKLIDADPTIAPRTSLYALADSLAALIDEMQSEGVAAETVAGLDVSDQSGHWERAKAFLNIVQEYLVQTDTRPDAEARQRMRVLALGALWDATPPKDPIILVGSTGSRGTTALLMDAIARLPQGAVVLPGFDTDMPSAVWAELDDALLAEDHPQYRFQHLLRRLNLAAKDIPLWVQTKPPSAPRNALISLSLRPAPVTHAWLSEGPKLRDLKAATDGLTLIEAPSPRVEALAIAMRLRKAVENGQTAALITPDRMLTRQVTAALDRWHILPDDSAGTPLHLSPPGRFLRHVAALFTRSLDAETLLTLLKHPLTHSGADRSQHQLNTRLLELQMRAEGLPFPDGQNLIALGAKAAHNMETPEPFMTWVTWVAETFSNHNQSAEASLSNWLTRHVSLAERIADGPHAETASELWNRKAGQKAQAVMQDLAAHAALGGPMTARDYRDLVTALLSGEVIRDRDAPHPGVMIWGTLEARVQGADLVILGGLNDGTWPEAPAPDPWLNRQMRKAAGLLLPERRIGLSAHDYQQAIAAPEVWLTRAVRSDEAETIPSRWLNRLSNLLQGLPQPEGPAAWSAMQARGAYWLRQVEALERVTRVNPAPRPSPKPPRAARLTALSVTEIKHLIRDPYTIYAKHILRLRPLNPLTQTPDAPLRGIVLHEVMERFIKATPEPDQITRDDLIEICQQVLRDAVPWPTARAMWLARIERVADWFIATEQIRRSHATPVALERNARGVYNFADLGVRLTGFADRIDLTPDGDAILYDYKTGTPPTKREQKTFDKQLLIEAAMVEEGGFAQLGPTAVAQATFIGLGSAPSEVAAPLDEEPPQAVLAGLRALLSSYQQPTQGFTARRAMKTEQAAGEYDQLARFGEWDGTQAPTPENLT